jgi:hypothetical protein
MLEGGVRVTFIIEKDKEGRERAIQVEGVE